MKKTTAGLGIILILTVMGCTTKENNKQPIKIDAKNTTQTAIKEEKKKFYLINGEKNEKYLKGEIKTDLTGAEIKSIYPLQVREGALMSISGIGFGEKAGVIKIGSIEVSEFLKWEDEVIWFRAPKGIKDGDVIKVGELLSEQQIKTVTSGTIRVVWQIDTKKAQEIINKTYDNYGAESAPEIEMPIYIKGQWSKKNETFGNYASNWDGGSKTPMYNISGTDVWQSECYFTEENFENFKKKIVYFAIEDSNKEKRKLSAYESDAALIIKKEWGAADKIDESDNDPGFRASSKDANYSLEDNTVYVVFPAVK